MAYYVYTAENKHFALNSLGKNYVRATPPFGPTPTPTPTYFFTTTPTPTPTSTPVPTRTSVNLGGGLTVTSYTLDNGWAPNTFGSCYGCGLDDTEVERTQGSQLANAHTSLYVFFKDWQYIQVR